MNNAGFQELLMVQGVKFFAILLVIAAGITRYLSIRRFFSMFSKRQVLSGSLFTVFKNIANMPIFIIVFFFSLQQPDVKVSTTVASLLTVAAMIAIGFIAVWRVLSNFLCSLLIILFTPFRIGDEIEITEVAGGPGLRGKVVDSGIMYTSILASCEMPGEEKRLSESPTTFSFRRR